jgi:phosphomannomutase
MNRMVVRQAAAGLAAYVREHGGHTIAIGYDARHGSADFARESAMVFAGAGLRALVLPRALPTPVLAYAIRHLGCDGGVMVTASHNPPQDNGYKVYLGDGCQIIPPADGQISAHIDRVAAAPLADIPLGDMWETLGDDVAADYVRQAASLISRPATGPIRVVYTPLHGVGGGVFEAVLERAGFPAAIRVDEQFEPDPDFPTVAFPNPEEPGAMDLAIATARRTEADLVIANDPDADRCAVAIPVATGWRMLRGDEVGSLLAHWLSSPFVPVSATRAENPADIGRIRPLVADTGTNAHRVFAQSIVSGTMLAAIAQATGHDYVQTLTGFKWIGRIPGLAFGYEEALGYCVDPAHVKDKDGITAALLIIEMARWLKERDRTLSDVLDDLDREHGVHLTAQVSVRVADLRAIDEVMSRLRTRPPVTVGGLDVQQVDDLAAPTDGLPPTDGLRFTLTSGCRVIIRPSGTEPKVKCYLQVVEPVADGDLDHARQAAAGRVADLREDVTAWLG